MVILLVEIGIDLVAHQTECEPTDVDALHSMIQAALLEVVNEDV